MADIRIPIAAPIVGAAEVEAVTRVLLSGGLAQGPEVLAFESEFSRTVGSRPTAAVNSGTSALLLALLSLGVGQGDEVIVPSFTFAATANAVSLVGARPVFVDILPDTFCMDPGAVEDAITPITAAIIPVHLYGHPADMKAICEIAERRGLLVVEDAAQAHLSTIDGQPVGTFGDAAVFSFYPTKNMTTGEGGVVIASNEQIDSKVRLLRNQGMAERYRNEIAGYNMRMTDIHAAIGRIQLNSLAQWTDQRRKNAARLDAGLIGVETPIVAEGCTHSFHQYTVRVPGGIRDEVARAIERRGIGVGVYYPTPVHRLPSFNVDTFLHETERAAGEVLSLPVHPRLTSHDIDTIVLSVNAAIEEVA